MKSIFFFFLNVDTQQISRKKIKFCGIDLGTKTNVFIVIVTLTISQQNCVHYRDNVMVHIFSTS